MKKGFTLLELLIVVVILGVLALIAAPTLLNAADQAKEGAIKANVSAAASSITSRIAVDDENLDLTDIVGTVVADLNASSVNPYDKGEDAFVAAAAGAKGQVWINCTADACTINGVKKDGTAVLTNPKIVKVPTAIADPDA